MVSHRFVLAGALAIGMAGTSFAADVPVIAPVYKASPQNLVFGGLAEVYGGVLNYDLREDAPTNRFYAILGGNFAVNIPLAARFSAQFDAQGEWYSINYLNDYPVAAGQIGLHLSLRDPNKGLIGVFGATTFTRDESQGNKTGGLLGGVEAQVYFGNTTLYGQVGYAQILVDAEREGFKGMFARGVSRYFTSDDSMIQLDVSYGRVSRFIDTDDWGKFLNWSLKSVSRLPNASQLYGTLEYRGGYYKTSDEDGDRIVEHAVILGLTAKFGAVHSLKHNDRYGATLDLPMLPARAAARLEALD